MEFYLMSKDFYWRKVSENSVSKFNIKGTIICVIQIIKSPILQTESILSLIPAVTLML